MSAECYTHGTDLVYPEGSWPIGVCPSCEHEAEVAGWDRVKEIARDSRYSDEFLGNVFRARLATYQCPLPPPDGGFPKPPDSQAGGQA